MTPVPDTPAISVAGLTRQYRRTGSPPKTALDGFDLTIPSGEVHGLLGPNGAGKTTLCKILSTVLTPTSGTAHVCGHDVMTETRAVRPLVGIVFGGERGLYPRLTARQNLSYWAALYKLPGKVAKRRVEELLERFGLTDKGSERVETYSRGMKQRVHLARGLVGDPKVVILDEPTTGMDPVAARDFRNLITELRGEGRTVLVTTHDMAEAEAICDRVTLIDSGRKLATEDPRTIGNWITEYERIEASGVDSRVIRALESLAGVVSVQCIRASEVDEQLSTVLIETDGTVGGANASKEVIRLLVDNDITAIRSAPPTLEEVYLHVIGGRGMGVR
ncbi:ABC-2 type transport system ATP-binding protein [Stackebrandtia endophytica]|uniref:ABC-2 type transport system ATP-binding protein n=1 Tax=Stackebrandtia endophytica TaxID=1496996 RepID=A0A543AWG0_9ACTN|nr:ABC-2 type transport system ATP-binding protein [Stackebrandtia endophytica]